MSQSGKNFPPILQFNIIYTLGIILDRIVPSFRFTKISKVYWLFYGNQTCDNDELVRSIGADSNEMHPKS